jgi:hypothetical protein
MCRTAGAMSEFLPYETMSRYLLRALLISAHIPETRTAAERDLRDRSEM